MKILVTGGKGMMGRELEPLLPDAKYIGSADFDLRSDAAVKDLFSRNKYDYVIHLAAHVGSLHDNIENQVAYFDNNVLMNTLVTKYAYQSGVKNLLGILSTCIYPDDVKSYPIPEEMLHEGKPHSSLMSYSYAKRSFAVQLDAYSSQFGVNYRYLTPSNLYGVVSESHKGRSHFVNDLVDKIILAKESGADHIRLFGDGTPMRQFMYAPDFAFVIAQYVQRGLSANMNVAPDENLSVDAIARVALKACDAAHLKIIYDSSKPNGQMRKDVSNAKLKAAMPELKFTKLEDGVRKLYGRLTDARADGVRDGGGERV